MALSINDEASMLALGQRLAGACVEPAVIFLEGPLGAGKTTLVRGFLRGLGHEGTVKSPTYTLVESYTERGRCIFHFDLYRLGSVEELELIGVRDYFARDAVCLIEWPQRGVSLLPSPDLIIYLDYEKDARLVALESHTPVGARLAAAA